VKHRKGRRCNQGGSLGDVKKEKGMANVIVSRQGAINSQKKKSEKLFRGLNKTDATEPGEKTPGKAPKGGGRP